QGATQYKQREPGALQCVLHPALPPLLHENITTVYGMEGGTISVNCTYNPRQQRWREKSWCKQIQGSKCQHVVSARRFWLPFLKNRNGTTSISDNIQDGVLTVTMRRLRKQDAGLYQCQTDHLGETSTLRKVRVAVLTGGSWGSEFHLNFTSLQTPRPHFGKHFCLSLTKSQACFYFPIYSNTNSLLQDIQHMPSVTTQTNLLARSPQCFRARQTKSCRS
uniref:Triggering receptor expressed on myeloid cells 2 n=1 Tax=Pavo cristatus TaxID=9049 RepID=A0A8C9LD75_PAVCR